MESKEYLLLGDLNCNYLSNVDDTPINQLKNLSTVY